MKTFTKILSLLLAAMMLLSLVACDKSGGGNSKKEETVVGKWEGELSSKALETIMGELDMDVEVKTKVAMFFAFEEDGKGKMIFDEEDMKEFTAEVSLLTLEAMAEAFEMTVDEMLASMEMTKEEYLAAAAEGLDEEYLESAFTYTVDGDKLTITDEDDGKTVITFAFENGNLVMKDAEEEDAEELMAVMFPMTLKRVK